MRTEDCVIVVGSERLAATKIYSDGRHPTSVISFHGTGATADRRRVRYLLDFLAGQGISSACFDFSGHGESTGVMIEATLRGRLCEAETATKLLIDEGLQAIIASSMGGYVAAMVTPTLQPQNLILFCPAAYPDEALDLKFDDNFGSVARKAGAYVKSSAFTALSNFRGNLLIFGAEKDTNIPRGVLESYLDCAVAAKSRRLIWLENAEHRVHAWLEHNTVPRANVLSEVLALIDGQPE